MVEEYPKLGIDIKGRMKYIAYTNKSLNS